ncbi:trypsin-like peptidase domain-containing protein [Botrimarina mediterranea]|uniref:trypsin-like peptidase domain-containing protein n=1 Tax=Botrimarina mediterranea TaxID=2528022 RepID=UPI00118C1D83|nr:Periplasmic serine endoprotease DegP precursor [Planctomycetes bacterium K2D]
MTPETESTGEPAPAPRLSIAQEREAGTLCAACSKVLSVGEAVAVCRDCGAVHHQGCWVPERGCTAYECTASRASNERLEQVSIRVSADDLRAVTPLPAPVQPKGGIDALKPRWNRASLWAIAIAILGAPLFGLITGAIAMLVACIALVTHRPNQRGVVLAAFAMALGLADIVGWAVGLSYYMGGPSNQTSFAEMAIDDESLNSLPSHIARAMRANVMINSNMGIGRMGIGSGVVLRVVDGLSYIVTNRHVIDGAYTSGTTTAPADLSGMARLTVGSITAVQAPASVVWVAPDGIDLALISARLPTGVVDEAHWNADEDVVVGDPVFAIGNPHGLGWTHTSGSISQVRRQTRGGVSYRILQTSAAINSGNSGGGLYDASGRLVGINTMTAEKRFAEGLGFSIAYEALIELAPEEIGLPKRNPDVSTDDPTDTTAPAP